MLKLLQSDFVFRSQVVRIKDHITKLSGRYIAVSTMKQGLCDRHPLHFFLRGKLKEMEMYLSEISLV